MGEPPLPRRIRSEDFCQALEAAGLINDLASIAKVTITAVPRRSVTITVERYADERLYLGLTAMLSPEGTDGR